MISDTYISVKKINDSSIGFIIGDSPTVTFNENVTVYTYPKISSIEFSDIEYTNVESTNIDTDSSSTSSRNKLSSFFKNIKRKFKL